MNKAQRSRAAYIAAHRILAANLTFPELATPGARRSRQVDAVAKIIDGVYEAHSQRLDEATDWWSSEERIEEIPAKTRANR